MGFSKLGLSDSILKAVTQQGYDKPSPIQEKSIPVVLEGKDLMAAAQTGTGKTAAFALPIIQKLTESELSTSNAPHALVLAPTRELAEQIANNFKAYAKHTALKVVSLFGGVNTAGQANALKDGVDVVVATPGRLLDHIRLGNLSLASVKHLVLDEADRMLDMGFIEDMQSVIKSCDEQRQILLFSATFPAAIKQFAAKVLKQPEIVRVDQTNSTASTVQHVVYPVEERRKQELLSELIGKKNWQQVLVFVNMKETADELVKELNLDGIPATVCHGDKSQGNRRRALREFKEGKVRVLVATEVAARGIDIEGLPRVINIDLPWLAEDYVHRIGRTGRAGNQGQAISFVSREEENTLFEIESLIGQKIKRVYLEGYEVSSREVLIDKIGKKPAHLRRSRTNKPTGQATGEARAVNRSRISNVRKSLKGAKLTLKK